MIFLRSLLYNIFFYTWTGITSVIGCLSFVSYRLTIWWVHFWIWGLLWGARIICGISSEVKGKENIPSGSFIIASKHQSAWDTLIFYQIFNEPVYVIKKGLSLIPFFGWYHYFSRNIAVDRGGGGKSLKSLVRQAKERIAQKRPIVIFPEGTRTQAGKRGTYHTGIYAIYSASNIPVVPVALNSGLLWGKNSFLKKSGIITLQFLPPIKAGLSKKEFMQLLEESIENAVAKL